MAPGRLRHGDCDEGLDALSLDLGVALTRSPLREIEAGPAIAEGAALDRGAAWSLSAGDFHRQIWAIPVSSP